ncbi:MAG: hypothetical protein MMC33_009524 [Icmadophila ericetorum]|nr:hypothetical protein [Icmadophila ericetorum]
MTDNGTPIELSWDWDSKKKSPTIRYSIEPIGITAGTPQDPHNCLATSKFHQRLQHLLTLTRLEWLDYFQGVFNCSDHSKFSAQKGHRSRIFYAFDLNGSNTMTKAYFFPTFQPQENSNDHSDVERLLEIIAKSPYCSFEKLQALLAFRDFVFELKDIAFKLEMLAIDLVDPTEARLKIYFRLRETSFSSVIRVMTLGGRATTSELTRGLEDLRRLWDTIFGVNSRSDLRLN